MSSVMSKTTKQAGTIMAMMIVLPFGFSLISEEGFAMLIQTEPRVSLKVLCASGMEVYADLQTSKDDSSLVQ